MATARKPTRRRKSRKKPQRGGARAGAGRPTLFDGKNLGRKLTVKLTDVGEQAMLRGQAALEREHARHVSISDTVEDALRAKWGQ